MDISLVISAALILAFVFLRVWAAWWTRRQSHRRMCELERYSQWMCPQCTLIFGDDVVFIQYAGNRNASRSEQQRAVIVVCPHCRSVTLFNANGLPADEGLQFRRRDELQTSESALWTTPLSEEHFSELLADRRLTH